MPTTDNLLPSTADLQKRLERVAAQKATEAKHLLAAKEAEKNALLDQLSKPSGVTDVEHIKRAAAIIERAVANGQTEVFVGRFPNQVCTDGGRAVNQAEPGWEKTLTGVPKELYDFWHRHLRPRGYHLKVQIIDFPDGTLGDIGATLSWG